MTPVERMLEQVDWKPVEREEAPDGDLPYATHSGIFRIGEFELRCYRLNDGMAILHEDDLKNFFGGSL